MHSIDERKSTVAILLATYNGERYLPEQLESIARQTYSDWHLFVSDDGSTDATMDVVDRFSGEHPGKVTVVPRGEKANGACGNFLHLIAACPSDYPYIAFCDQDDVWLEEKLAVSVSTINELESQFSGPCLVFCDAEVSDSDLNMLAPSFFAFTGVDSSRTKLPELLVQNPISGAGVVMNETLLAKIQESASHFTSEQIAMHDQWVGLIAACFGNIAPINEPLYQYRQHGENAMGAIPMSVGSVLGKAKIAQDSLRRKREQASVLLECYAPTLTPEKAELIKEFVELDAQPKGRRVLFCIRRGALMNGALRNAGLLFFI